MQLIKVGFLIDKSNNWFGSYLKTLDLKFNKKKIVKKISFSPKSFKNFDILFIINYTKILNNNILSSVKIPLVIHASKLPKGKGFSPLLWQVIKGKREIFVTLFKAVEELDSGPIFLQNKMKLNGTELYDELREKLAQNMLLLITRFMRMYPNIKSRKQIGKSTFYKRRQLKDSNLNINKSIKDQFNLLRVCNNNDWPAYFIYKKKKYIIKIYKNDEI